MVLGEENENRDEANSMPLSVDVAVGDGKVFEFATLMEVTTARRKASMTVICKERRLTEGLKGETRQEA